MLWLIVPAGLAALYAGVLLSRIVRFGQSCQMDKADAIVVFGAAVWSSGPSRTLRIRLAKAASLYQRGLAPVVICSGGLNRGRSESAAMRSFLLECGLPDYAVIPDDGGSNTRRGLRAVRQFQMERLHHVLLVSSPYHMYRIFLEARRQNLSAIPCPASPPHGEKASYRRFILGRYLREMVAVIWYRWVAAYESLMSFSGMDRSRSLWRHLSGRLSWIFRDADAVARGGDKIAAVVKSAKPNFSDVSRVLTPAGGIGWPVEGSVGNRFGLRWGRLHAGTDLRAPYGTEVVASAGGTVVFAEPLGPYGNVVVVDHHGGVATVYAHLCGIVVSKHQQLSAGTCVGYVGTTGRAYGPHLHFEVRVHGSPVDPMVYLERGTEFSNSIHP